MKKILCLLLAAVLLLSLCACAAQVPAAPAAAAEAAPVEEAPAVVKETPVESPAPAVPEEDPSTIDAQIDLLFNTLAMLQPTLEGVEDYQFTVCDLDHNGRLEMLVLKTDEDSFVTDGGFCEVTEDFTTLKEIPLGEEIPEFIMAATDTFHDEKEDVWYYLFNDTVRMEKTIESRRAYVSLKDGELTCDWAVKQILDAKGNVTYEDKDGNPATADDFLAGIYDLMKDFEPSHTNFDWFAPQELTTPVRMLTSWYIFNGDIEPAVVPEEPTPSPSEDPDAPIIITKNPTSEKHMEGETSIFIAGAKNYKGCSWSFTCDGQVFGAAQFTAITGCGVSGAGDTTLKIYDSNYGLNNWHVFCTFSNGKQTAMTSVAGFTIIERPKEHTTDGKFNYAGSDNFATSIFLPAFGTTVYVSPAICRIEGVLYDGCPCIVHYKGNMPTGNSGGTIFRVEIYGSQGLIPDVEDPWVCGSCGGDNDGGVSCAWCGAPRWAPPPAPDPDPTPEPTPEPAPEPTPAPEPEPEEGSEEV